MDEPRPMTFKEFQATGYDVDCLEAASHSDFMRGKPGRVYTHDLYIERTATGWDLELPHDVMSTDDGLTFEQLEQELYVFAGLEEMIIATDTDENGDFQENS